MGLKTADPQRLVVEKTIQEMDKYPTRKELWNSLSRKMQYQTLKSILIYLEQINKIRFYKNKI